MCNVAPDVMQKLEATAKQFLDENRAFTGYELTLETRQREHMQLRHNDVRGGIHEIQSLVDALDFGYDAGNGQTVAWRKTLCPIGPNGQGVFVYHPASFDPKNYQPRPTAASSNAPSVSAVGGSTAPVAALIAQVAQSSDAGGDNGDGTFSPDYRRRLLVQSRFVRDLSLKAKESAFIGVENGKVVVMGSAAMTAYQGANSVATLAVERSGNLYLSAKILSDAGLNDAKFKIDSTTDTNGNQIVEVTQA